MRSLTEATRRAISVVPRYVPQWYIRGRGPTMSTILQPLFFEEYHRRIKNELDARVTDHRAKMTAAKARGEFLAPDRPLVLLADGDSWFDYPMNGDVPLVRTDIIAQLKALPAKAPHILSFAHYGDATTASLGVQHQERLIQAIHEQTDPRFDAILYSGGGDDIAGDQFCLWLNDANLVGNNPANGLNGKSFASILDVIKKSYTDLIELRDAHLPGKPIFCHEYDFAFPTGLGVCGLGPWLKPSLDFRNWAGLADGAQIVKNALLEFKKFLASLAANDVVLVPTQGTLAGVNDWANELHPTRDGFGRIAAKFRDALATKFPGRI